MSKKLFIIPIGTFGLGLIAGGLFISYSTTQIFIRSGIPFKSIPDVLDIIRKYETLGFGLVDGSKKSNTSPETMIKFTSLLFDIVKENPEIMDDPRFVDVAVNHEFEGITKDLDS